MYVFAGWPTAEDGENNPPLAIFGRSVLDASVHATWLWWGRDRVVESGWEREKSPPTRMNPLILNWKTFREFQRRSRISGRVIDKWNVPTSRDKYRYSFGSDTWSGCIISNRPDVNNVWQVSLFELLQRANRKGRANWDANFCFSIFCFVFFGKVADFQKELCWKIDCRSISVIFQSMAPFGKALCQYSVAQLGINRLLTWPDLSLCN